MKDSSQALLAMCTMKRLETTACRALSVSGTQENPKDLTSASPGHWSTLQKDQYAPDGTVGKECIQIPPHISNPRLCHRYCEGIFLRLTTVVTTTPEPMKKFAWVGILKKILTYQGISFTSQLMKMLCCMLSLKDIVL